jgi:hypothetical protein
MAAGELVTTPTSVVVRTSYRLGCGSVSWSVDRTGVYLRYALTFYFHYAICTKVCLANYMEFHFQDRQFDDEESRPTLDYR